MFYFLLLFSKEVITIKLLWFLILLNNNKNLQKIIFSTDTIK